MGKITAVRIALGFVELCFKRVIVLVQLAHICRVSSFFRFFCLLLFGKKNDLEAKELNDVNDRRAQNQLRLSLPYLV